VGEALPQRNRASETFGLNNPPVMRKNSQALTRSERPILVAIYIFLLMLELVELPGPEQAWIPPKPRSRKKVVPMNSREAAWRS